MNAIIAALMAEQWQAGLPGLAGASGRAVIPVAESLLNALIARSLPATGHVRELTLEPLYGNRLKLRLRVNVGGMALPFSLTVMIDEQPVLPQHPVLTLRLSGLPPMLTGAIGRLATVLPPGLTVAGNRLLLNLHTLLAPRGQADVLRYVSALEVTTEPQHVILSVHVSVPLAADPGQAPTPEKTPGP
jgi:hypothetical protein